MKLRSRIVAAALLCCLSLAAFAPAASAASASSRYAVPTNPAPGFRIMSEQGWLRAIIVGITVALFQQEYSLNRSYLHRVIKDEIREAHGAFVAWLAHWYIDPTAKDMCDWENWPDYWPTLPNRPYSCGAYDS